MLVLLPADSSREMAGELEANWSQAMRNNFSDEIGNHSNGNARRLTTLCCLEVHWQVLDETS